MSKYELNRMFDRLAPDPKRKQELLQQLLQDCAEENTSKESDLTTE